MLPLRSVGRCNFDKGRHNLTTLIQETDIYKRAAELYIYIYMLYIYIYYILLYIILHIIILIIKHFQKSMAKKEALYKQTALVKAANSIS